MPKKLIVCLIDDNQLVRESLAFTLRDHGMEVEEAPDGGSGLQLALAKDFDVVLTDLDMPGVHGLAVIQGLRARKPHLPIIAITGATIQGNKNVSEVARGIGADLCLNKPFKPSEMLRAIAAAVAAREPDS
jgi:CheY-like chemotaxis protein